jgi:diguanylate cyclase (GGDEF)-like protein
MQVLKSPVILFRLLIGLVALSAVVGILLTMRTTSEVETKAQTASERAELAQIASESSDRLRAMNQIAEERIQEIFHSPAVADQSKGQQRVIEAWLSGVSQSPPTASIANIPAELSMDDSVAFQSDLDYLRGRVATFLESIPDPELEAMRDSVDAAIDLYYRSPTLEHLRDLQRSLAEVQERAFLEVPGLSREAVGLRDDLASTVVTLRWAIVAIAILAAASVIWLSLHMSRVVQRLLTDARTEQDDMANLTRDLEYRNNQLNALYNVFNEITDTLSLRYVVKATMYESLKIMRAEMVVVRILRGDDLEVAGAMTSSEQEIKGLESVKLGEGPTGRTAKRGRTLRIDEGGERMMAPPDVEEGALGAPTAQAGLSQLLESGLIAPLIVGARIVGTISCWAREKSAFNESDERIFEMMASQVATAIVAADTTEKSERRAHQDALTSLPNRRQLDEDVEGRLVDLVRGNRQAVIAMVDIDHFKRFNDEYGHRVGDVTLQAVASVLQSSARDNDLIYRYGGEEFVVVFEDTSPTEAFSLANRLRLAVERAPLSGEQMNPVGPVTVSIGLALLPDHGTDLKELIGKADRAMYLAKERGRNRVEVWAAEGLPLELDAIA